MREPWTSPSGHPELLTATEPLIEHELIDLALCVEDDPGGGVPTIVLSHRAAPADAEVWIRTAPAGVAAAGTVHRLDGVPLTLQPPLRVRRRPTAATVLADLLKATDI